MSQPPPQGGPPTYGAPPADDGVKPFYKKYSFYRRVLVVLTFSLLCVGANAFAYRLRCSKDAPDSCTGPPGYGGPVNLRFDGRFVEQTESSRGEEFNVLVRLPYNFGSGRSRGIVVTAFVFEVIGIIAFVVGAFVSKAKLNKLKVACFTFSKTYKLQALLFTIAAIFLFISAGILGGGLPGTMTRWEESDTYCDEDFDDNTPCKRLSGSNDRLSWGPGPAYGLTIVRPYPGALRVP